MSRTLVGLFLLAFALAGLAVAVRAQQGPPPDESPSQEAPPGDPCVRDRMLVKVRPGADPAAVIARYGGTIVQTIPSIDVHVVTVPSGTAQQALDGLNADPEVAYAEPDGIVRALEDGSGC